MRTRKNNFVRLSSAAVVASAIVGTLVATVLDTGSGDAAVTTTTADPGTRPAG